MAEQLPTPVFHHLHLNCVDPDAAIAFYVDLFPSSARATWGGHPALACPDGVFLLFDRVSGPPPTSPTAFWHFGWHVPDAHGKMEGLKSRPDIKPAPLYTGDGDRTVLISSDSWPAMPGTLGRTKAEIEEAKAQGIQPTHKGGFAYVQGPEGALVEYAGDFDHEFFNHVHMFQNDPFCANLWYQKHLNASPMARRAGRPDLSEDNCKVSRSPAATFPSLTPTGMYRTPAAGVAFGQVTLPSYMPQDNRPLAPTRGHQCDHIAFAVADLDAWLAKLQQERVTILEPLHPLGETRAFMVEGPSREAIELVEA